jgi:hypothetical protein
MMRYHLAICVVAFTPATVAAQDQIHMLNTFGEAITVWFWPDQTHEWIRPALYMPSNARVDVNLTSPGSYYIVVRDQADRDVHVGWRDLHQVSKKVRDGLILLDALYVPEQRTETSTVMVQKTEIVTGPDGKKHRVTRMVPEQRTRTFTAYRKEMQLKIRSGDRVISIDDVSPKQR